MYLKFKQRLQLQFVAALLAFSFAPAATGFQSGPGRISGQVILRSGGSPLAGATVTVTRLAPAPPVTSTAVTDARGAFAASGLPTGQYGVCVKASDNTLLDPCNWTEFRTTVQITSANPTPASVTVRVAASSALNFQVNDAAAVLTPKSGATTIPRVLVGVFDMQGMFHPALQTRKDTSGTSYQVNIPFDSPVRMVVYSAHVQLSQAQSGPVSAKGFSQITVQPSNKAPLSAVVFTTTGIH